MTAERRVAILWHHYEAEPRYRENLLHFLALTLDLGHPVFIAAASPLPEDLPEAVQAHPGLHVLEVPNHGYDFGGHGALLRHYGQAITAMDAVIFVNSSVRGPFLQQGQARDWTRIFTDRLDGRVELVGATACDLPVESELGRLFVARHGPRKRLLHVQSTAYALSRVGLARLMAGDFHAIPEDYTKFQIIVDFEIRMTDVILRGGGDVTCLMPIFAGVDFRAPDLARFSTSDFGNLIGPEDFLGAQADPSDVLFTKVNLKDQDLVALAGRSWCNLNLNLPEGWRACPPVTAMMAGWRAEAEEAAARHLAAQKRGIWRRILGFRNRIERIWQKHLRGL